MSLWKKPLSDVTFDDVKQFCELRLVEGTQVDYKLQLPKDLAKTIAAFANTMGGIIIVGVDEDDHSQPVLPIDGFEVKGSFTETVYQVCQQGIYPSILPEVTNPIPIPDDPGKYVGVIRVPQSSLAPHAISNGTRVYIRTGNISTPEELSNVDRIQALFQRRINGVRRREELLQRSKDRFASLFSAGPVEHFNRPTMWAYISPYYAEGQIATLAACRELARGELSRSTCDGTCYFKRSAGIVTKAHSFGLAGDLCRIDAFFEGNAKQGEARFFIGWMHRMLRDLARDAISFYSRDDVRVSGPLAITVGLDNVRGMFAQYGESQGHQMLDDRVVCETTVNVSDLLSSDPGVNCAWDCECDILHQFAAAVDLPQVEAKHYRLW